jgi:hypothetical protein
MLVYSRLTRRHIKPVERIGRLGLYPAETAEKIRVVSRGGKRPGSGPKRKSNKNL